MSAANYLLYYECSKPLQLWEFDMSVAIRIDEEIYNEAKKTARAEHRSIPGQIAFWAMVGKCALDNPDLPIEFVKELLIAKHQDISMVEPFIFEGGKT